MNKLRISPAIDAVLVGDAEPGDLLFPKGHPDQPLLVIGGDGKFVLSLEGATRVFESAKYAHLTAIRVLNDWRFKLGNISAKVNIHNPTNVEPGKIAISSKGRHFVSLDGTSQFEHELLVSLDKFELEPDSADFSVTCFPTDWLIERHIDSKTGWELLFDPKSPAGKVEANK